MSENATDLEEQDIRGRLLSCFKEDSKFFEAVQNIPPDLMIKDETELGKLFSPTPLHYALKKNLWEKFYDCEKTGDYRLKNTDVYGGICSNPYFYKQLLENPARVAWLIAPPINTSALIEEAFRFSFEKVRDGILNMPVTEKSAPILLKAFQYFADRHLGPMIHRIESKNLNVEVQGGKVETPTDPREIEEKLREIRAKLLPVRDVSPRDE